MFLLLQVRSMKKSGASAIVNSLASPIFRRGLKPPSHSESRLKPTKHKPRN